MKQAFALVVLALGLQAASAMQPHASAKLVSELSDADENAPMLLYGRVMSVGEKSFLLCLGRQCIRVMKELPAGFAGRSIWVEGTKRGNAFYASGNSIDVSK